MSWPWPIFCCTCSPESRNKLEGPPRGKPVTGLGDEERTKKAYITFSNALMDGREVWEVARGIHGLETSCVSSSAIESQGEDTQSKWGATEESEMVIRSASAWGANSSVKVGEVQKRARTWKRLRETFLHKGILPLAHGLRLREAARAVEPELTELIQRITSSKKLPAELVGLDERFKSAASLNGKIMRNLRTANLKLLEDMNRRRQDSNSNFASAERNHRKVSRMCVYIYFSRVQINRKSKSISERILGAAALTTARHLRRTGQGINKRRCDRGAEGTAKTFTDEHA